jgi:hypothetical protein
VNRVHLRIMKRRKAVWPAVAACATTLVPKAATFTATYNDAGRYRATWQREMAEGRGAVGALVKVLRDWLPLLQRDVPGFDSADFADTPEVHDLGGRSPRKVPGPGPQAGQE